MKKLVSVTLALILYSQSIFAVCNKPVTYLKEGASAACNGYLFTPEQELLVRDAVEDNERYKHIITDLETLTANQDKRIALEVERYSNIKAQLDLKNDKSMWERLAWFIGGVAVATGVIYVTRNK